MSHFLQTAPMNNRRLGLSIWLTCDNSISILTCDNSISMLTKNTGTVKIAKSRLVTSIAVSVTEGHSCYVGTMKTDLKLVDLASGKQVG